MTVETQLPAEPAQSEAPPADRPADTPLNGEGRLATRQLRLLRLRPQTVKLVPPSERKPAPPPELELPSDPAVRLRHALVRAPARALVGALLGGPVAFGLAALLVKLKVVGSYAPTLADLGGWSLLAAACVALEVGAIRRFAVGLLGVLAAPWAILFSVKWTGALLEKGSAEHALPVVSDAVEQLLGQLRVTPLSTLCGAATTSLPLAVLLAMRALRVRAPAVTQCLTPLLAAVVADTAYVAAVGVNGQTFWTGWTFKPVPLAAVLVATAFPHALGWTALAFGLRLGDRLHDLVVGRFSGASSRAP